MKWLSRLLGKTNKSEARGFEKTGVRCRLPSFLEGVSPRYEPSELSDIAQRDLVFRIPGGGELSIFRYPPHPRQEEYRRALQTWLQLAASLDTVEATTLQGESEPVHWTVEEWSLKTDFVGLSAGDRGTKFHAYLPSAGIKFECIVRADFADRCADEIRDCAISLADTQSPEPPAFSLSLTFHKDRGSISID